MSWEITGNDNIDQNINFLGTTKQEAVIVKTNNKEAMRVDPAGNVGIGTPSPQNGLHVGPGSSSIAASRVNAVVASNTPDAGIAIAQNIGVNVLLQASTAGGYLGTTSNHHLVLRTNDLDRVVVDVNGNVGIGTSTPATKLEIVGDLKVSGDILLPGADCAEQFDIAESESIEPGTVVVIDQKGALRPSQQAYDKKVAGVVSGAGEYRSGIVLDKRPSQAGRAPVALVGKVYCKVDAQYSPIEVGDLLTSSPTPGYAMKADNPLLAFGAVIGKALRPLMAGQELIPILIALQ